LPEIQNPNLQSQGPGGGGGGGDLRSSMAFVFLMLAAVLGYQFFFAKPKPATPTPAQTQTQSAQTASSSAAQAQPGPAQSGSAQPAAAASAVTANSEQETTVENELYKIVFTNRGGQVKHWILKKYFDTAGKPLDMVQPQIAAQFGLPLSLFTYDPALTTQLNGALYQVTVNGAQPSTSGPVLAPAMLVFHYAANGLDVAKSFSFDSSYVVNVNTEVKRNGAPVRALVEWPGGLGDMEEFLPSSSTRAPVRTPSYFAWSLDGKHTSLVAKKVSGNATLDAPYSYAAITDLYFAAAFLPDAPERTTVVTLHNAIDLPSNLSDPTSKKTPADVLGLAVGDTSGVTHVRLFAGPKATAALSSIHAIGPDGKAAGQSLEPLIQFGMWTFIAKPLYIALRFLRNLMGPGEYNWGWAIIIVTVLFTILMLPTRIMMMKSSLKMMRIQPKVEAIKKRYAHLKMNDPKKVEMNAEMMGLYKQEGVNMYGGCLPMLVQMPLFFAYYRVLGNAIELRQAHWFWLTDLSMPDPLYILPVLIILTMFFTQYITPSPGMDPAQRRMMAFMMPAVIGFSMLHFASGLALYWGTSNVLYLVMQLGVNRSHWGKEMHAIAARRSAKKLGSTKTIQGRR
jgi:YidC/Oxa1 family membrane protein insertase